MAFIAINPATGRRIAVYRDHSHAQIERMLAAAIRTQRDWRALAPRDRARLLAGVARELRARRDPLAKLAAEEMGKPVAQGRAEVEKCAQTCDYFARHAATWLAPEAAGEASRNARVCFEPLGTILAIMPWNFPFWQAIRAIVPAIAAGNVVLLKPAPSVPACAQALEKIFTQAGLPRRVVQVVFTRVERVPALIADPRVHAVTLTGSTRAGKAVAALAGAAMKPGVYELGGSDPAIVLDDADLERAAETCAEARLLNAGQSCICAKRFVVVRSVLREFESLFVERVAARKLGHPLDASTDIGPLARADLRAKLVAQVAQSVRRGARLLLPGGVQPGPGFFFAPTVLGAVAAGMPVHDEETFGPVAAIVPVRDEAEAIRVAGGSRYGLGAAVFTRDRRRAQRVAARLEAGCVFINDFVRSSPDVPFGGIKDSGYGRELGRWGLHAFVNVKAIVGR